MSRSKRYNEITAKVEDKEYTPSEAISFLKEQANTALAQSLEVHVRLGIDIEKSDQNVRGTITFPHHTGKQVKVIAFVALGNEKKAAAAGADVVGTEAIVDEIMKTKKTDFDVAVAEPAAMKTIGKIAKILGQRGLMPNPKAGTLSQDIETLIKNVKSGQESFKMDATGNVHVMLGKLTLNENDLEENLSAFMDAVRKAKPESLKGELIKNVTLTSTMGPGLKVKA